MTRRSKIKGRIFNSVLVQTVIWAIFVSPITFSLAQSSAIEFQIDSLNKVAFDLRNQSPELSLQKSTESLALSERERYDKGKAVSLNIQGLYHKNKNRWELARQFYFQSLELRLKIGDEGLIAQQLLNIGNFFRVRYQLDSALTYYDQALAIQRKLGNESKVAAISSNIALVYKDVGEYDKALKVLYRNLNFQRKKGSSSDVANAVFRVAEVNERIGNYQKSKAEYQEAIRLLVKGGRSKELAIGFNNLGNVLLVEGELDSAQFLYEESREIREELGLTADLAGSFLNLGEIARIRGQKVTAKAYAGNALNLFLEAENRLGIAEAYYLKAEILFGEGQYEKARELYKSCLEYIHNSELSTIQLNVLDRLADISSINADFKSAYNYSAKQSALLDSVNRHILAAERRIRNQDVEINNLENKIKLNDSERKRSNLTKSLYGASGVLLFLLGVIIVLIQRQRSKRKSAMIEKEREIDRLMGEHGMRLLSGMVKGQAEERRKISNELHGQLGTLLVTAKMQLEMALEKNDSNVTQFQKQLETAHGLLANACEEVRNISHGVSDEMVLRYGFQQALADLVDKINTSGKLHLEFLSSVKKMKFDESFEIEVFRLTQDLISNILKHSNATDATVQYLKSQDNLSVLVEDNGVGFDPKGQKASNGLGISSIQSRVEALDGTVNFDPIIGQGTTVMMELPIPKSKN